MYWWFGEVELSIPLGSFDGEFFPPEMRREEAHVGETGGGVLLSAVFSCRAQRSWIQQPFLFVNLKERSGASILVHDSKRSVQFLFFNDNLLKLDLLDSREM